METSPVAVEREAASDVLHAEAALLAARLNRANSELVELAGRLLEDDLWAGGGISSPEHWLVLRLGLSPARARDVTRLARRRDELPHLAEAQGSGQLSIEQASVVAQYIPAEKDLSATELAVNATVPQLRRALARYQFAEPGSPEEEPGGAGTADGPETVGSAAWASKPPELSMSHADGRFSLRFSAPSDVGALVEQAVLEAKDALFRAAAGSGTAEESRHGGGETSSPDALRVTCADALLELANRSLTSLTELSSDSRTSKYRVYVHLATDGAWIGGRGSHSPVPGREVRLRRHRPARLGDRRRPGQRRPRPAHHARPHPAPRRGPRPRLPLPRLREHAPRRGPPPRPLGRRRPHRSRAHAQPLRTATTTAHHRGEFTMTGDPGRPDGLTLRNEHGRELRPPSPPPSPPASTPPDPAGSPAVSYDGPTGERLHLRDLCL